jgi:hypothetical protein
VKKCFTYKRFGPAARVMINRANEIIAAYAAQGFDLTLRQLYYQFVSRGLIANKQSEYKRLGAVVNEARLAGLIDWDSIVDRTRNLQSLATWGDPAAIVAACARQFRLDLWEGQEYRPEVWIEKEALAGVFEPVCNELRVSFFCCRGYTSQSEMYAGAMRLKAYADDGQTPVVLHFGDHDPSGVDMTRDIKSRLELFIGDSLTLERLALNMDQIEEYAPPPNPCKLTDSRARGERGYVARFGNESWELDALDPATLAGLVREAVTRFLDREAWDEKVTEEREHRRLLSEVSANWAGLTEGL